VRIHSDAPSSVEPTEDRDVRCPVEAHAPRLVAPGRAVDIALPEFRKRGWCRGAWRADGLHRIARHEAPGRRRHGHRSGVASDPGSLPPAHELRLGAHGDPSHASTRSRGVLRQDAHVRETEIRTLERGDSSQQVLQTLSCRVSTAMLHRRFFLSEFVERFEPFRPMDPSLHPIHLAVTR